MTLNGTWNRIWARAASPLAEVSLATSATMALGAAMMALTGWNASAGLLWVAVFYGVIGLVAIVGRLRHIAFADHLSRDLSRVRSAPVRMISSEQFSGMKNKRRRADAVAVSC